jgi:UDP-N-acetylglucosamine/UDP-N-acetylgalactosamine diphosphorylase
MFDRVASRLRSFDQDHVLRWCGELDASRQARLLAEIDRVDFALLRRLHQQAQGVATSDEAPAAKARRATPPSNMVRCPRSEADATARRAAHDRGMELFAAGRVGALLVAGGQGTRLDFPHPKGMFPIGPVSGKSLFQWLAEQLLARSRKAAVTIPYYVMTSDATHAETEDFFRAHTFFGLDSAAIRFFPQGNMPAVDAATGRVLLASKSELSLSPDGHGGLLAAMSRAGLFDDLRRRGIEYLYYHQVDNPLARVCDPEFLGLHALRGAYVSVKVVAKRSPEEKMGVVVDVDGRTQIIEYSDLPADVAAKKDERGDFRFWAGNTAIHVFRCEFLADLVQRGVELPFHIARKTVPYFDEAGQLVQPPIENAIKFERFIFDVLPLAKKTLVVEADRDAEFNPLKNKSGEFSPPDVQRSLVALHRSWLRAAGVPVSDSVAVEISPLFALGPDDVAARKADVERLAAARDRASAAWHISD